MTQDLFMHAVGIASLTTIFCVAGATAVATIVQMLGENWGKIALALRGAWFGAPDQTRPARPHQRRAARVVPESSNARKAA